MTSAEVPERLVTVRRVLAWVLIGQVAVLAATGIVLVFSYRPTPMQAWGVLTLDAGGVGGYSFAHAVRTAHRWTAWSTLLPAALLAAVACGEALARWTGPLRRRSGALTGPATAVLVIAGVVSGFVLPWDQLALWGVAVGTEYQGFTWLLRDDVRFVLLDGAEVSVPAMRAWFSAHVLVIPLLLAPSLWAMARRGRPTQEPHQVR